MNIIVILKEVMFFSFMKYILLYFLNKTEALLVFFFLVVVF